MKYEKIRNSLEVSRIALGCWRMDALSDADAQKVVENTLANGINFFDHADIYGDGASEEKFGSVLKKIACPRDKIIIQSKAGIHLKENYYDFSKERILEAVDGSLRRLRTDYLDILLLHRPDTLFDPDEIAEIFDSLEKSGKVRFFGVSNQNPFQIELIGEHIRQELIFNQMQFSVMHTGLVDSGLCVNNHMDSAVVRDGGALEYCRMKGIRLQAWSPFQYGFFEGVFLDNPKFPKLNEVINTLAKEKGVKNTAVAAAWILRHPAFAQCIAGTMNPARLSDICKAVEITLTRKEWYDVYKAAGNILP